MSLSGPDEKPSTETIVSASGRRRPGRKQVAGVAPDHQPDQPVGIGAGERLVRGDHAVLEDGDMVAEPHDFVQPVGNVEDRRARFAQRPEQPRQGLRLVRRQRRGRLVEDQHPRFAKQRLGDLDHLPSAERQVADRPGEVVVEPDHVADRPGPLRQRAIVDQAEAAGIGAEPDILGDRERGGEAEFLLDDRDAGLPRLGRRQRCDTACRRFRWFPCRRATPPTGD